MRASCLTQICRHRSSWYGLGRLIITKPTRSALLKSARISPRSWRLSYAIAGIHPILSASMRLADLANKSTLVCHVGGRSLERPQTKVSEVGSTSWIDSAGILCDRFFISDRLRGGLTDGVTCAPVWVTGEHD